MNSAADRINRRMTELKISQADIARATGAGKATISSWVKGDTKPSGIYATKLARYLRCNTDWMLSGIGDMDNEVKTNNKHSAVPIGTELILSNSIIKGYLPVIEWNTATEFISNAIHGTEYDVTVIDQVPKPSHLSDLSFALKIRTRNMMPEFKLDEVIFVEPQIKLSDLKDGDLLIVVRGEAREAIFKQLVMGDTSGDMMLGNLSNELIDQELIPMSECQLIGIVDSKYTRYR